jgi:multiple sugar transport system ATP-binding protein/lactose/L-arabinose transport system ATP-binding protein
MSFLRLENIVKTFGEHPAVQGVSLEAEQGEFVVFVGPSGCGKSTLLRIVAGLEDANEGEIYLDGARVTDVEPARRQVAMVFQSYALFPHMTVRGNIGFGLKMAKKPRAEIDRAVAEAARILQIGPLLDRKPRQLSGGQRQRVAIGRAIVRNPKLFLFDEPLSNLDAELRTQMRVEIARLHRDLGVTMVFVTHDQVEAMTLADRIVVLRGGRIEQVGSPTELYLRPANTFVAGFIGSPKMNFVKTKAAGVDKDGVVLSHSAFPNGTLRVPTQKPPSCSVGDEITLGLRPEHLVPRPGAHMAVNVVAEFSENLGGTSNLYGQTSSGETVTLVVPGHRSVSRGETLAAAFDEGQAYLFDAGGKAL